MIEKTVLQAPRQGRFGGLQRFDLTPIGLRRRGKTSTMLTAVHKHGTGSAIARITTDFDTFQVQIIAQNLGQTAGRVSRDLPRFALDAQ
jgi:hypothetical protein